MVASVPLETKRIFSIVGMARVISVASSISSFGGDAEAGAALGLVGDCGGDGGIGVAQENGAPGADVVEELVSVRVIEIRTFAAIDY